MLVVSLLKNFPAATSVPPMFSASAFFAVPISLGRAPPKNIVENSASSALFAGVAIFKPDLI